MKLNNSLRTLDAQHKIECIELFFSGKKRQSLLAENAFLDCMLILPQLNEKLNSYRHEKVLKILGISYSKNKISMLYKDSIRDKKQDKKTVVRIVDLTNKHKDFMLDFMSIYLLFNRFHFISKLLRHSSFEEREYLQDRQKQCVEEFKKKEDDFFEKYEKTVVKKPEAVQNSVSVTV